MGFWNRSSNAKPQPSDGERAVQEIIQRVSDKNQRARENWETQDHRDFVRIVEKQEEQLEEVRKLFLPYALRFIHSAKGVEHIEVMDEMLRIGTQNMLGRLPEASEQSAFYWYAAGVADIGRMLVEAKAQADEEDV